jgi:predicted nucleic acid-binding protein
VRNNKYVVIFDTNIFLQALIRARGPAVSCLEYFDQGEISRATLAEIADVLTRPQRNGGWRLNAVSSFTTAFFVFLS